MRGSARNGRMKIRVNVGNTNRKKNGFQTHIFIPETKYNWNTINEKLIKKFGKDVKWGIPRRVNSGYGFPIDVESLE